MNQCIRPLPSTPPYCNKKNTDSIQYYLQITSLRGRDMVSFLEVLSFFLLFLVCSSTSLLGTPPKSCRTKKLPQNFEETCKAQNWECFVVEARISRSPPVTHNCSDLSKMIGICCNTDLRTKCCERHPLGSGLRGAPRCPRTH